MRKAAMSAFARLPRPVRLAAIRLGTPSFTVGAVAVLRRDGRVLLVEQRHTQGWALPGGLLRRGEDSGEAVVREVAEEVGVDLAGALPVPFAAIAPDARRVDVIYVLDAPPGAQPRRADEAEVRRLDWFALDALPDVTQPTVAILRAVRLV